MDVASDIILPAALALIMLGMGLSLSVADFARFRTRVSPVFGGLFGILIVLPALAFAVATAFHLPPLLGVGLILVGACPGGTFSNLLTHYAKGDLALSVTLTAVSSFCVIFSMPLIVEVALSHFLGEQRDINLPVFDAMRRIFLLTICPVAVGMIIHKLAPKVAQRFADHAKNLAGVLIIAVFLSIIYTERETFLTAMRQIALPVIALNLASVSIGTLIGFVTGGMILERRAITLEHTIKQEGLGIFVALSLLGKVEIVLPLMLNSLVGLFVGISIVAFARIRGREHAHVK